MTTLTRQEPRLAGVRHRTRPVTKPAAESVARWLRERGVDHPVGVFVFGSGWSPVVDRVEVVERWPYAEVPGLPPTSVKGHPGYLVLGVWHGLPCLLFVGRWHLYEGRTPAEVAAPSMVAAALGSRWLFCTNAAGGIAPGLRIGQLVALTDDISIWSPCRRPSPDADLLLRGQRRSDGHNGHRASTGYSAKLLAALFDASRAADVPLEKGVLAMMPGPNYETAAEIRMLRIAGASVVSMSTVPEARCARMLGLEVAALSCVTNLTPARPGSPLSHDDVLSILDASLTEAGRLLDAWLEHPEVRGHDR